MEFEAIREDLKQRLKPSRYLHTIGVVYTAASLAMCYGCEIDTVMYAALLHDASKAETRDVYIDRAKEYGLSLTEHEIACPELIHGKLSAYIAKNRYGINDTVIIDSIICHTTGKPQMNIFDKILFVADYIEPSRTKQKRLKEIRETAFKNIDEAILMITEDTLEHLKNSGFVIDPATYETYLYYKKEIENV